MSIIKKIKDYYKKQNNNILFTTPSHSQGKFIIPNAKNILGDKYFKSDFSEIEGFDNLRCPDGIIKKVQTHIANIYKAKSSFMLINGSTSGILAAMLAVLKRNDKVLIARNCHISVYNGLVLTGAVPVWFLPDIDEQWGIYKGIKAGEIEEYLNKYKDIKALIITSPTYEGLFSEVEEIARICKKHNVIFIVDEAHGALLNFADFKAKPAVLSGADISIQSLHKTAGAINPAALLHISKSSKVLPQSIQNALNLINTTSPSYPLMADIEATTSYLNTYNGKKQIKNLLKMIKDFKEQLPKDITAYDGNNDMTKILLKFNGYNPQKIASILNKQYKIEEEYTTNNAMLFITGIGTDKDKLKKLLKALKNIIKTLPQDGHKTDTALSRIEPIVKYTPAEAYQKEKKLIDKNKCVSQICGECILEYPPGIPLMLPGEMIQQAHIPYIDKSKIQII